MELAQAPPEQVGCFRGKGCEDQWGHAASTYIWQVGCRCITFRASSFLLSAKLGVHLSLLHGVNVRHTGAPGDYSCGSDSAKPQLLVAGSVKLWGAGPSIHQEHAHS